MQVTPHEFSVIDWSQRSARDHIAAMLPHGVTTPTFGITFTRGGTPNETTSPYAGTIAWILLRRQHVSVH